jgi:EAL domain-containing protein (putative c-di-GMP-specific phosphodiesterase class I)/GGDEF domain-containing protein
MRAFKRPVASSFKNRLLTLIVSLVFIAEGVTVVLTLASLNRGVTAQAKEELRGAQEVLLSTLQLRRGQLRAAADVLVNDFAFKSAIGDNDRPTMVSALDNHRIRVGADVAILYGLDGAVLASTIPVGQAAEHSPVTTDAADVDQGYAIIAGRAYQLVYARVRAPQPIATVALAFALDQKLALQLGRVANARIGFVVNDARRSRPEAALPDAAVVAALRHTVHSAEPSDAVLFSAHDGKYLAVTTLLPTHEGTIDMVLLRPMDLAGKLFRDMWPAFVLIALATLLAAIVVASVVGSATIRPLSRLVEAARRIAEGSYERDVVVSGDNEFRELASAFNVMQAGIRVREQHIVQQAMRDSLTGLASRAAFVQDLAARAVAAPVLTLAMLDVRRFRDINASVGFESGSQLLCELAARLQMLSGPEGGCARLSADLFAMHFSEPEAAVRKRLLGLSAELRGGLLVNGVSLGFDLCCGLSEYQARLGVDDFMRQASVALVEAKERQVGIVSFDAAHDLEQRRRITLVADLRRAIDAGELKLVYQPLVQMSNREAIMLEALVRWRHPKLGEISPSEFVPLAERASLQAGLSRWVLATAIAQLGRWHGAGVRMEVAVNLSAADLSDASLTSRVQALLENHGVPAELLVLEVTESTIMESPLQAVAVMKLLRARGVRFAVDDFGTGHSSLAQLHTLPVDELKIDRAFVTDLDTTPANQAIVRSTIELGHVLGLRVVAEGIETPEVWSLLMKMGCDLAQGYFISRPMSVDRLAEWVDAQATRRMRTLTDAEDTRQLTSIRLRSLDSAG